MSGRPELPRSSTEKPCCGRPIYLEQLFRNNVGAGKLILYLELATSFTEVAMYNFAITTTVDNLLSYLIKLRAGPHFQIGARPVIFIAALGPTM